MLHHSSELDAVFAALSDPTRRGIVSRLSEGPRTVSELAEPLPMSLSAVGQHLRLLERSGIVRTSKNGRVRSCELRSEMLSQAERWFAERRVHLERRLDRLEAHLSIPTTKAKRK